LAVEYNPYLKYSQHRNNPLPEKGADLFSKTEKQQFKKKAKHVLALTEEQLS